MGVRRRDLPGAFHIAEAMARDAEAADALLVACRTWANEARSDCDSTPGFDSHQKVRWPRPPHTRVEMRAVYTRGGDFMARVLDTATADPAAPTRSCRRERIRRACRFRVASPSPPTRARPRSFPAGRVLIDDGANGGVDVELPQTALARFCIGGFDPTDVLARLPTRPDPEVEGVLRVLFPRGGCHTSTQWIASEACGGTSVAVSSQGL